MIYVGALSDIEQKEKKDRIDDAVCAVEAALEEGILPGGGVALFNEATELGRHEITPASNIMIKALRSPMWQIITNAGKDAYSIMDGIMPIPNEGYDVKAECYADMIKAGIVDPTKVTKNALKIRLLVYTNMVKFDCWQFKHQYSNVGKNR